MLKRRIVLAGIPAVVWGEDAEKAFLFVHGKLSSKEAAAPLAGIAAARGYQTVSFDLPGHGERRESGERCDVWSGTRDLLTVADHVFSRWKEVSLFACSLGAYFSLQTLGDRPIRRCLFQSPIVDMEYLIRRMMDWFGITQERLEREKEIDTPIDVMTWAYYRYVLEHPVRGWDFPTAILYAGRDSLQSGEVIARFAARNRAVLTICENSEHPFLAAGDDRIVRAWISGSI